MKTRFVLSVLLLALACPPPCRPEIFKCVGPQGAVHFTDRDCPPGFSLNASIQPPPSSAEKSPFDEEWARSCQFISVMTFGEVTAAIADAEKVQLSLKGSTDPALPARWDTCLARLKERKRAVTFAPSPGGAIPPSWTVTGNPPDTPCRAGEFATENGLSSYEVYFTNSSNRTCTAVKAYCLCSISFGAYRQSKDISVTGSFAPGERTRVASVSPTGPRGGGIDWSWCKFRP